MQSVWHRGESEEARKSFTVRVGKSAAYIVTESKDTHISRNRGQSRLPKGPERSVKETARG